VWHVDHICARLAAMAEADPECQKFGARRHHYMLGPVLAEAEVIAFEERHRVILPQAYRSFLTAVGDGGAGPDYGLFPLEKAGALTTAMEEREMPDFLATPFPHTEDWNPSSELDEDDYLDPRWVVGSLVIAEIGCGSFYRLVITGQAQGEVWYDDRASDVGLTRGRDFYEWYMTWVDAQRRRSP
jgi:hypothetical protein